jgi:hypothetical protein
VGNWQPCHPPSQTWKSVCFVSYSIPESRGKKKLTALPSALLLDAHIVVRRGETRVVALAQVVAVYHQRSPLPRALARTARVDGVAVQEAQAGLALAGYDAVVGAVDDLAVDDVDFLGSVGKVERGWGSIRTGGGRRDEGLNRRGGSEDLGREEGRGGGEEGELNHFDGGERGLKRV